MVTVTHRLAPRFTARLSAIRDALDKLPVSEERDDVEEQLDYLARDLAMGFDVLEEVELSALDAERHELLEDLERPLSSLRDAREPDESSDEKVVA